MDCKLSPAGLASSLGLLGHYAMRGGISVTCLSPVTSYLIVTAVGNGSLRTKVNKT